MEKSWYTVTFARRANDVQSHTVEIAVESVDAAFAMAREMENDTFRWCRVAEGRYDG